MNNGKIKVVTGIRRCGKSVLVNEIFFDYLIAQGIPNDQIIRLSLECSIGESKTFLPFLQELTQSQPDDG